MKTYLNLGCGRRFSDSWTNIDFVSSNDGIMAYDLRCGIPFSEEKFDVVYHSHVLEHFSKQEGLIFIRECYRVLKPGGIIRIAVPNLEIIARLYLQALEKALKGDEEWKHHYDWIKLEMYDQTVRNFSGGEMGRYLEQEEIPNRNFILQRSGVEGQNYIERATERRLTSNSLLLPLQRPTLRRRLHSLFFALRHPAVLREERIKRILGQEYELLQVGRFRYGGEVHLWMYDSYSLGQLLHEAGFHHIQVTEAARSMISEWSQFNLDTEPDGTVYKPDSFYMEALKL